MWSDQISSILQAECKQVLINNTGTVWRQMTPRFQKHAHTRSPGVGTLPSQHPVPQGLANYPFLPKETIFICSLRFCSRGQRCCWNAGPSHRSGKPDQECLKRLQSEDQTTTAATEAFQRLN